VNFRSAVLEILFYIVYISLFWQAIKEKEEFDEDFSKVTAQSLKGICCLAIFGHHYGQVSGEAALGLFTHFGYLVLNIFFMISGYGVSYGLKNKEHYLKYFLVHRCGKIVICYWIMNGITVLIEYISSGRISINSWKRWTEIFFLRDASYTQSSWYMMMLFWLYFFFYLAARISSKYLQFLMFILVACIIFYNIRRGMPLWYYNYLFSFNVGIYMANRKEKEKEQIFTKVIYSFVIFVLFFIISKIDRIIVVSDPFKIILKISAILSSTALSVMVMLGMRKIKVESKLLYILGGVSTGVYIFHTCIILRPEIQYAMQARVKNWGICLWISLGITIVASAGIKKLLDVNRDLTGKQR